eukprot:173297-Chlamydomonas_euryale.AAC.2
MRARGSAKCAALAESGGKGEWQRQWQNRGGSATHVPACAGACAGVCWRMRRPVLARTLAYAGAWAGACWAWRDTSEIRLEWKRCASGADSSALQKQPCPEPTTHHSCPKRKTHHSSQVQDASLSVVPHTHKCKTLPFLSCIKTLRKYAVEPQPLRKDISADPKDLWKRDPNYVPTTPGGSDGGDDGSSELSDSERSADGRGDGDIKPSHSGSFGGANGSGAYDGANGAGAPHGGASGGAAPPASAVCEADEPPSTSGGGGGGGIARDSLDGRRSPFALVGENARSSVEYAHSYGRMRSDGGASGGPSGGGASSGPSGGGAGDEGMASPGDVRVRMLPTAPVAVPARGGGRVGAGADTLLRAAPANRYALPALDVGSPVGVSGGGAPPSPSPPLQPLQGALASDADRLSDRSVRLAMPPRPPLPPAPPLMMVPTPTLAAAAAAGRRGNGGASGGDAAAAHGAGVAARAASLASPFDLPYGGLPRRSSGAASTHAASLSSRGTGAGGGGGSGSAPGASARRRTGSSAGASDAAGHANLDRSSSIARVARRARMADLERMMTSAAAVTVLPPQCTIARPDEPGAAPRERIVALKPSRCASVCVCAGYTILCCEGGGCGWEGEGGRGHAFLCVCLCWVQVLGKGFR